MQSSRGLILAGSAAAFISAITTFLLWYLPNLYSAPDSFETAVLLAEDPAYMGRLWVNFAHVFVALFAYGVAASILAARVPGLAITGFVAFAFWAFAEAIGVSINIWGVNELWRAGFNDAGAEQQMLIRASIHSFQGLWEGIFFVVLVTFLIGTLCYGVALFEGQVLQRSLAILFILAAPLTVIIILDGYFGAGLSAWVAWAYPVLQPVSRALLGVWLFRVAVSDRGIPYSRQEIYR